METLAPDWWHLGALWVGWCEFSLVLRCWGVWWWGTKSPYGVLV